MTLKKILGFFLFIFMVGFAFASELDDKLYPGNMLSISLIDNKVISKDYRIDPQGNIIIPEVGQINCNNQTLSSLHSLIVKKLSTIFKNASLVTISKKSDDYYINVLGLVKKPGYYLIVPQTSFQEALLKAGGFGEGAQMNKVQLRHAGQIILVNYRKYLDNGDEKILPKLQPLDEIFVPSSKLISNINITPSLTKDNKAKTWLDTPPERSVSILGGIVKPGRYLWSSEMNLLDLIAEAGGPTKEADTGNISIITKATSKEKSSVIKFNLSRFMEQGGNVNLIPAIKPGYTIKIPEFLVGTANDNIAWVRQNPKTVVYVFGEVRKPGRYRFDNKLNFLDILSAADGPTEKAELHDVHLIDRQGIYPQVVHVNLSLYFETGDPELIPPVLTGDAVYVPAASKNYTEISSRHVVKILGEVSKPGRYRYTDNMTLLDLLSEAGGPTSQAWVRKILIVNIGPNLETKSSVFDLVKFSRTGDLRMLPALREGDVVYVPNNQEDDKKRFAELLQNLANIALLISYGRNLQ